MARWKVLSALAFVVGALLITGTDDYEAARASADKYCEMVKKGHWGEFKQGVKCD